MRASVPAPNIRALIVDDEAPSRRKIKFYLRGVADVEVAGECRTGAEAVEAIERDRPDLVFLDVQMPGMNGFDVIRELQRRDAPMPAVIFVTAYDQFALQAFEVMAVDYLLKPFNQRRFERGLERVRATLASADLQTMTARLRAVLDAAPQPQSTALNRLLVRDGDKTIVLAVRDIQWVGAANNYLEVHTARATFLVRKTMTELDAELPPSQFVRIHRSTLVSVRQIRMLRPLFNKDHAVTLLDGTELVASRTYYDRLIAVLTAQE